MSWGTAVRLVVTAVAAYLVADRILTVQAPLLAPLTALLIVQVSLYQTLRHSLQRVLSVTTGVVVAVVVAGPIGFTWWSLGLVIGVALLLGRLFKLGDHILEVPISAMLILQLGTETPEGAADRVVETIIGALVGLIGVLLTAPIRVEPAEKSLLDLASHTADLLDSLADDLHLEPGKVHVTTWLGRSRRLSDRAEETEVRLTEAEESARLNPRARTRGGPSPTLRTAVSALEHVAIRLRGLAFCMADRTWLQLRDRTGLGSRMWAADVRTQLALTLRSLSGAVRLFAATATAPGPESRLRYGQATHELLVEGRGHREALGALLRDDPGHWPLHGELLAHLDRLLDGLAPIQLGVRPGPPETASF
ncbi:aromatic acid exporter family protein [Actinocorallia sp. B10E7]|uniref:aromatic acid exporter family protein n=1 Tax=Actinocorallia sp. B10E7 TaxID=3153558 RepID=UPI00325D3515